MCDVGKAVSRAFGIGPSGGEISATEQAQAEALDASNTATAALTKAINDATAASLPVLDNPSALAANKQQMQKLLGQQGAAWAFGNAPTVAPTVATRALSGA